MVDVAKVNYFSGDPIDKVVQEGSISIVNDGATSISTSAKIVQETVANSYGRATLMRARWSTNGGTDWQALETEVLYTFNNNYNGMFGSFTTLLSGLRSAVSVGCSDDLIYFRTANGLHGDVAQDDVGSTYTPTSLTFLIQYALYERD
jgi:hypothetical protein